MADLGCTPSSATAFQYFLGKGLDPVHAAAIVGNLQFESHLDPKLEVMDTNNKMSRGIAMWQPPRWASLQAFAAGRDPLSLGTQLDFVWAELPSNGLQQLLASSTLPDAVVAFQNNFEKPLAALAHTDQRIAVANNILTWCHAVQPPSPALRGSKLATVFAVASVLSVAAVAGVVIYRAAKASKPTPAPLPPIPSYPRPVYRYRPIPFRPEL